MLIKTFMLRSEKNDIIVSRAEEDVDVIIVFLILT